LAVVVFTACFLIGCGSKATREDLDHLEILALEFGERYRFELESEIYVKAYAQTDVLPSREEAEQIYRRFFMADEGRKRSNSAFTYLNVYDRSSEFLFQVSWDPHTKRIERSNTEFY
jgi:hypothetical protein